MPHLPPVPITWYLILSAVLFVLGVAGFLYRKSVITVFMSIELMLNAVNLSFVSFSYHLRRIDGHLYSLFVMVVAAAEAAVGFAIILTFFNNRVTLLIDVYAIGYMAHEGGYYRFFSYFNLFLFFMLILVLASNLLVMFVGWEGVGLCSYLLIGFYFLEEFAGNAANKAFIVNRIGDF